MRIDKYLWCVRLFKTRTQATEACKKGHVCVGSEKVKPAREVFNNERIYVRKNQVNYEYQILEIPNSRVGAKLVSIYLKDLTPPEALANLEFIKAAKNFAQQKGQGRPTKKDRRDLDDWFENNENE